MYRTNPSLTPTLTRAPARLHLGPAPAPARLHPTPPPPSARLHHRLPQEQRIYGYALAAVVKPINPPLAAVEISMKRWDAWLVGQGVVGSLFDDGLMAGQTVMQLPTVPQLDDSSSLDKLESKPLPDYPHDDGEPGPAERDNGGGGRPAAGALRGQSRLQSSYSVDDDVGSHFAPDDAASSDQSHAPSEDGGGAATRPGSTLSGAKGQTPSGSETDVSDADGALAEPLAERPRPPLIRLSDGSDSGGRPEPAVSILVTNATPSPGPSSDEVARPESELGRRMPRRGA